MSDIVNAPVFDLTAFGFGGNSLRPGQIGGFGLKCLHIIASAGVAPCEHLMMGSDFCLFVLSHIVSQVQHYCMFGNWFGIHLPLCSDANQASQDCLRITF